MKNHRNIFRSLLAAASLSLLALGAHADTHVGQFVVKNIEPLTNLRCVQSGVTTTIPPYGKASFYVYADPDKVTCNAVSSSDLEFFAVVKQGPDNTGVEQLFVTGSLIGGVLLPARPAEVTVKVGGTLRGKNIVLTYPTAVPCTWVDGFCY